MHRRRQLPRVIIFSMGHYQGKLPMRGALGFLSGYLRWFQILGFCAQVLLGSERRSEAAKMQRRLTRAALRSCVHKVLRKPAFCIYSGASVRSGAARWQLTKLLANKLKNHKSSFTLRTATLHYALDL